MGASRVPARELAREAVGPARVITFGVSNVAPAGAVVAGLIIMVSYAGFASPLVVLVAATASVALRGERSSRDAIAPVDPAPSSTAATATSTSSS